MNDLREQAMRHVLRVEKLKEQHAELEDLQDELSKIGNADIIIGFYPKNGGFYKVLLEDLGITSLQDELKKKLVTELHIRKEVIEMTLTQLIGGDTK